MAEIREFNQTTLPVKGDKLLTQNPANVTEHQTREQLHTLQSDEALDSAVGVNLTMRSAGAARMVLKTDDVVQINEASEIEYGAGNATVSYVSSVPSAAKPRGSIALSGDGNVYVNTDGTASGWVVLSEATPGANRIYLVAALKLIDTDRADEIMSVTLPSLPAGAGSEWRMLNASQWSHLNGTATDPVVTVKHWRAGVELQSVTNSVSGAAPPYTGQPLPIATANPALGGDVFTFGVDDGSTGLGGLSVTFCFRPFN